MPMMWAIHEEEVVDNIEEAKVATKDKEEARELLTLIQASGVREVEPVMAKGGMMGQINIEATLGLRGQRKCPQILAWEHMIKTQRGVTRSSAARQAIGCLKKPISLEGFGDTFGGKGNFQEKRNDRNPI